MTSSQTRHIFKHANTQFSWHRRELRTFSGECRVPPAQAHPPRGLAYLSPRRGCRPHNDVTELPAWRSCSIPLSVCPLLGVWQVLPLSPGLTHLLQGFTFVKMAAAAAGKQHLLLIRWKLVSWNSPQVPFVKCEGKKKKSGCDVIPFKKHSRKAKAIREQWDPWAAPRMEEGRARRNCGQN